MNFLMGSGEPGDGAEPRGAASVASSCERTRSPLRQPEPSSRSQERRPFGGIGSDSARIIQELRHRVQNLERQLADQGRCQQTPEPNYSRSPERRGRTPQKSRSRCTPSPRSESDSPQEENREAPRRRRDPPDIQPTYG
ncbi:uncharacterized protein LOC130963178 [Arachis stenosperma]|uniref:uncharacterized protein LOC130963178 n=1 Tax=Arachis stenosperma TaxID=217475 RepID=UPI0025AB744E|nr:uncharacterized protein LOC130963178 [Arachis stenosperma]